MSRHETLDDAARETCALAALGVLTPDEAAAFEAHAAGCPACRAERESLRALSAGLAGLAPAAEPPERLWSRIAEAVHSQPRPAPDPRQPWRAWTPDAAQALFSLPADAGGWEPAGAPGVQARRLFVDHAAQRVTMMVRMEPGAAYPAHRHAQAEECFVLSGDLWTGSVRLRAGDYQRAEQGSRHPVQSTEGGCVLLLVSSLGDTLE
jgi:anti-sigma factor ChrR (cupin superfamily)